MAYKTTYPYSGQVLKSYDNVTDQDIEKALADTGMPSIKLGVKAISCRDARLSCTRWPIFCDETATNMQKS